MIGSDLLYRGALLSQVLQYLEIRLQIKIALQCIILKRLKNVRVDILLS